MADEKSTPVPKLPRAPTANAIPRPGTQTNRDVLSELARRARLEQEKLRAEQLAANAAALAAAGPGAVPIVPFDKDDVTGQYEGEQLAMIRAQTRTPTDRIGRLEKKHDALVVDVKAQGTSLGEAREALARIEGELTILPSLIGQAMDDVHNARQREHVTVMAQIDLDRERSTAEIEIDKHEQLDLIDKKKARRTRLTKLIGLVTSGGVIVELLHQLLGHL